MPVSPQSIVAKKIKVFYLLLKLSSLQDSLKGCMICKMLEQRNHAFSKPNHFWFWFRLEKNAGKYETLGEGRRVTIESRAITLLNKEAMQRGQLETK